MIFEPNNIISRIEWCLLQQLLPLGTREECEGRRAEEAGLVDAFFGRDRAALVQEKHRSQCTRYQRGFEDGQALLHFHQVNSRRHDTYGGVGPGPLTASTQVDGPPSQAPSPMLVESRRCHSHELAFTIIETGSNSRRQVRPCTPRSKIMGEFAPLTCSQRAVPCCKGAC